MEGHSGKLFGLSYHRTLETTISGISISTAKKKVHLVFIPLMLLGERLLFLVGRGRTSAATYLEKKKQLEQPSVLSGRKCYLVQLLSEFKSSCIAFSLDRSRQLERIAHIRPFYEC